MCGMTRAEDITHGISLGIDAIGLIFFPESPRNITIKTARQLLQDFPPFVTVVAVLVNPESAFVKQIIDEIPIQLLQFHGEESPEFCQQFDKPYIKAIPAHDPEQIQHEMEKYTKASALLLDTPSQTAKGGTGLAFDWSRIPKNLPKPYILAGGLNQLNIQEAIKATNPYAVDVSSGIESEPGVKDHLKMNEFIKALWGIK